MEQEKKVVYTSHRLLKWLAKDVESYLEVGVCEGASLRIVLENATKLKKVTLVDDWGTSYGGSGRADPNHVVALIAEYDNKLGDKFQATVCDADSKECLHHFVMNKDQYGFGLYDLIFVDGDHSDFGATIDLYNAYHLLAKGGKILFDDTNHPKHGLFQVALVFALKMKMEIRFFKSHTNGAALLWKR